MTWRMGPSFTMLLALWLVCGSEPHPQAMNRGSHGGRKVPLVSPVNRRPARFLRHTGRSQGIARSTLEEPNLQPLQRRRSVPVLRVAQATALPAPLGINGALVRPEQRPTARSSPREMVRDEGSLARSRMLRFPSGSSNPNILASFAGKNRVWVISAPHASDSYYRLMMSLLKDDVYCELAERHIQQIVLFHQAGEEGGKVRRITSEGRVLEQPLDPNLIPKLMSFLKLEKGKFGMVLLKKTLQVEERYPYPVRLEAMYEIIDQSPIRRIEKIRQKGFVQKCKASGVEGQVVAEGNNGGGAGRPGLSSEKRKEDQRRAHVPPTRESRVKVMRKPATTTGAPPSPPPTPRATTLSPASVTTVTRATSRVATVAVRPTTTTAFPTTQRPWTPRAPPFSDAHRPPATAEVTTARAPVASENLYPPPRKEQHRERPQTTRRPSKATSFESFTAAPPTTVAEHSTRAGAGRVRDNRTDRREHGPRDPNVVPGPHKPAKGKPPKKKAQDKILSNEYEDKYELSRPTASQLEEELQVGNIPPQKAKESKKHEKLEKPEKEKKKKMKNEKADKLLKSEKQLKKDKAEKKSRQDREKSKKKKAGRTEQEGFLKPTTKHLAPSPRKSATDLLGSFEGKRRLLLITTPKAENNMYVQQRDEYLESFCKMATRKISVITIFGPINNSTMKIDHFQLDNEKPMRVVDDEDLVDQHLISELRKEYGMTYNDFFMVLTDVDLRVKQYYEVPIAMKSVFDLIDTFQSRIKDMEKQKKEGIVCKEDKKQSLENFLSRFRWRRRLLVISAPSDEDWAYSQQLAALSGQACNFGLRHITILKLLGVGEEVGGVLELFPINGSSVVEREDIPAHLVKDIRNYFQVSPEYFSMLLVGKDGNVKSWYPSPMWSMVIVYDLIDSMQLRRQEMAIQQSLGMRCPEDEYAGYGYHSYHQGYQDGYQDDYRHHESYHHGYPY
ncbi:coiled-coil domain-containing protein 80 [Equus przewalskii]|nr:coiled-coil domain-containing protein 80 [Equus caballus]XP_005602046.1 coiled-coil domain-containing protein 80 [Equus caballus]XP_005602047.1 coiled-coil domain-containing protein 80 [Equus caballus]XP_005602048.1 coiled-coil domain-containing protein 80 [Equus caballus]XP_008528338.1 PREDICTED: coiled-coil domain-containing protein 80 [Equus przewalskii]XP_008528347.1 PREDICTED: coiled-coil domain-containing protein 80 [Equus przewalskii]XP_008528356.1 PREDICTED: coiled-coil domain-cont